MSAARKATVAREPVQLSDDQLRALALALRQRLRQFGAGGMLFDFGELADQLPGAAVEVVAHGALLRVKAEAAGASA